MHPTTACQLAEIRERGIVQVDVDMLKSWMEALGSDLFGFRANAENTGELVELFYNDVVGDQDIATAAWRSNHVGDITAHPLRDGAVKIVADVDGGTLTNVTLLDSDFDAIEHLDHVDAAVAAIVHVAHRISLAYPQPALAS